MKLHLMRNDGSEKLTFTVETHLLAVELDASDIANIASMATDASLYCAFDDIEVASERASAWLNELKPEHETTLPPLSEEVITIRRPIHPSVAADALHGSVHETPDAPRPGSLEDPEFDSVRDYDDERNGEVPGA